MKNDLSDPAVRTARRLVTSAAKVVVLTGAGVSTASGIPDYRGPQGVWTRDPSAERLSNISDFLTSPEIRAAAWQREVEHAAMAPRPNAAHRALAQFEHTGKLSALVTQNVDGLHQAAGSSAALVFEVHGGARTTRCLRCADETPTSEILLRVHGGDVDPHCRKTRAASPCGGLLKTAVVSFGQSLPADVFATAELRVKSCDLLVCVGSTLSVRPVSGLVDKALSRSKRLVIVNAEPTEYDPRADAVVRGDIGTVLGDVLGATP